MKHSQAMRELSRTVCALALLASAAFAVETRFWSQSDYADFEKGVVKNLSMRSDGVLSLAPQSRELFDASSAYLWALAQDSKGNLYAGGAGAKLFQIAPDGKSQTLAEFDALEIHAIAVDSKDRIYAATSPDGKVYRLAAGGKPEVFYEPKTKYIWALAFDGKGNLFVATGDHGEIHRVGPDGKGGVFFRSDETHARSMAVDSKDNLIVGTDPGGIVLRVSPAGEGFVLYQMPKREVTAVAVARDGAIYAAAVGSKAAPAPVAASPAPAPAPAASAITVTISAPGSAPAAPRPVTAAAPAASATAGVSGGSDLYRIDPDGVPRRMWSNAQEVVYAIAFDAAGRPIIGAGNRGKLYRIESPTLYTNLLTEPATQITAFQAGRNGRLYAATGSVGKVYEIGPGMEREGTVESDVFDAAMFSLWGQLTFEAKMNGAAVAVTTRSGNVDSPQRNWSPWSPAIADPKGGRLVSPAARFVQWKATLTAAAQGASPEMESVTVAYLPKNLEPRVDLIEMTPANYKFPNASISVLTAQQTLNLPALGRSSGRSSPSAPAESTPTNTPTMQYVKGWVGARWMASDPNGDALEFKIEIRGAKETNWKPLKAKQAEKYVSWDSSAYPDGEYVIRVTASDAPGNPPSEALTGSADGDVFIIDNTPPEITGLSATRSGEKLEVRWRAADALNDIAGAEYSLDGGEWTVAAPVTKLSDAPALDYALSIAAAPGEHTVAVRVKDDYDNQTVAKAVVR
jgi:sugar lactone lactonase YvrE